MQLHQRTHRTLQRQVVNAVGGIRSKEVNVLVLVGKVWQRRWPLGARGKLWSRCIGRREHSMARGGGKERLSPPAYLGKVWLWRVGVVAAALRQRLRHVAQLGEAEEGSNVNAGGRAVGRSAAV